MQLDNKKTTDKNVSCLKEDLQLGDGKKTIDSAKTRNILRSYDTIVLRIFLRNFSW